MKTVIFAAAIATAASAAFSVQQGPTAAQLNTYTFEQFEKDFHKTYPTEDERAYRRTIFETELKSVRAHNNMMMDNEQPLSYKKGINHMSDHTMEEFKRLNGDIVHDGFAEAKVRFQSSGGNFEAPDTLDYRKAFPSVLTAVKDQGHCGSCWAHAGVESIESAYAIKTGELYVLSQQELTSCVPNDNHCGGTGGCFGATANLAIDYASANGITEEWSYGYQSFFGNVPACDTNRTKDKVVLTPKGHVVTMPRNDAAAVMESLYVNGPLAISVDASDWHSYESGIYSGCDYSKNITMNHAVQLVGYGTDASLGLDYWVVRNSWSAGWGEAGFIRLVRESGSPKCGWDNDWVTIGGGCNGEANTVWSCGQCGILFDTLFAKFD